MNETFQLMGVVAILGSYLLIKEGKHEAYSEFFLSMHRDDVENCVCLCEHREQD